MGRHCEWPEAGKTAQIWALLSASVHWRAEPSADLWLEARDYVTGWAGQHPSAIFDNLVVARVASLLNV